MTIKITYWTSDNRHSKPVTKYFTNVLRVYDHYSSWSDNDYIAIQDDKTTKYIIRDDITHLDIRCN